MFHKKEVSSHIGFEIHEVTIYKIVHNHDKHSDRDKILIVNKILICV